MNNKAKADANAALCTESTGKAHKRYTNRKGAGPQGPALLRLHNGGTPAAR